MYLNNGIPNKKMVEKVLELAIRCVLIDDQRHGHLKPTWQDALVLNSIYGTLKPVASFTEVVSRNHM